MGTALITRDFNGSPIVFRADGWFNMTKAAKQFGTDLSNFMRSPETAAYVEALNSVVSTELTESRVGRYGGGTWARPKLAVFFARWLEVRFSVWCDAVMRTSLGGPQRSPS